MKNKYNIGLEIFFINIVLVGYILTSGGEDIPNYVISIISSSIATIINLSCLIKLKKKRLNLIFFCLNLLVLIACIVLLIIKLI